MDKSKKKTFLSLFSLVVMPVLFYPLFVFALGMFEEEMIAQEMNEVSSLKNEKIETNLKAK